MGDQSYQYDGLGSVRGVVDDSLAVLQSLNYAPYGEPFGATGSSQTPFGFTGEPTDANGLSYLRARYYSPMLGVFTALDPFMGVIDKPMSLNGYSWVEGNVPNAIDPTGLCGGSFCNPDDPDTDIDCWLETYKLFSDYGAVIRGRWSVQEINNARRSLDSIAFSLGKGNSSKGAARFRYYIAPLAFQVEEYCEIPQYAPDGTPLMPIPCVAEGWVIPNRPRTIHIRRDILKPGIDTGRTLIHEIGHTLDHAHLLDLSSKDMILVAGYECEFYIPFLGWATVKLEQQQNQRLLVTVVRIDLKISPSHGICSSQILLECLSTIHVGISILMMFCPPIYFRQRLVREVSLQRKNG